MKIIIRDYLLLIITIMVSFIVGFIGLIYGDFKTGLLMLIICSVVTFFIGHFVIQHNWYNEFKIEVLKRINETYKEIPYVWLSLDVYDYLKFRYVYGFFQNERKIIKCITEVNPMRFKKETIKMFIFSKIPDHYILNKDYFILAIIRFTNEIDATPFVYDIEGNFIGIVRVNTIINSVHGDFITNSEGIYTHRLLRDVYNHFYLEPVIHYNPNLKGIFKPMLNITFTNEEKENFKKPIVKI